MITNVLHRKLEDVPPPNRSMKSKTVILNSGVPIRRSPAALARRFAQICMAVVAEFLADEDLTPLQYAAVAYLDDEPDIDQNALVSRLGVEQSHGSLLVEQLVVLGLVERHISSADRRARQLRLTPAGSKLYQRLHPAARLRQIACLHRSVQPSARFFWISSCASSTRTKPMHVPAPADESGQAAREIQARLREIQSSLPNCLLLDDDSTARKPNCTTSEPQLLALDDARPLRCFSPCRRHLQLLKSAPIAEAA